MTIFEFFWKRYKIVNGNIAADVFIEENFNVDVMFDGYDFLVRRYNDSINDFEIVSGDLSKREHVNSNLEMGLEFFDLKGKLDVTRHKAVLKIGM